MIDIPTTIRFSEEPDLWDIQYSDCYFLDHHANVHKVFGAVTTARTEAGGPIYHWIPELRALFTDDQLMVEKMKESLYLAEIAYRHTHIPKTPTAHDV